jgi:hypothetical protein
MKCNSCGNDIAPNSVSCPVCGASISNTSVLPVTPDKPVLPSDQNVDNVITTQIPVVVPNEIDEKVQMGNVELSTTPVPSTPAQVITDVADTITVESGEKENVHTVKIVNTNEQTKEKKKISPKKIKSLIFIFILLIILGVVGYYFYNNIFNTSKNRLTTAINHFTSYISSKANNDSLYKTGKLDFDINVSSKDDKFESAFTSEYGIDIKNNKVYGTFNIDKLNLNDKDLSSISALKDNTIYFYDTNIYANIPSIYDKYVAVLKMENIPSQFGAVDYTTFVPKTKNYLMNALRQMPSSQSIGKLNVDGKDKMVNITKVSINANTLKTFNTSLSTMILNDETYITNYAKLRNISVKEATKEIEALPEKDTSDAFGNIEIYTSILGEGLFKTEVYGFKAQFKSDNKMYILKYTEGSQKEFDLLVDSKRVAKFKYNRRIGASDGNKQTIYDIDGMFVVGDKEYTVKIKSTDTEDKETNMKKINIKDAIDINHIPNEDRPNILQKIVELNILDENTLKYVQEYLKYDETQTQQQIDQQTIDGQGEAQTSEPDQSQEVE